MPRQTGHPPLTDAVFQLGERYRAAELASTGTTVVRPASPWGRAARISTTSLCCSREHRIDAAMWAGLGAHVTCGVDDWKWTVYPASEEGPLQRLNADAVHLRIPCDRAQWVSRGHGTRERPAKSLWPPAAQNPRADPQPAARPSSRPASDSVPHEARSRDSPSEPGRPPEI